MKENRWMNNTTNDIYGVPLLDNLHDLFPEILYDSSIFPHNDTDGFGRMLSWIRYRISHLYPQTFNRARQNYAQNMATGRREDYDEWVWLRALRNTTVPNQRRNVINTYPSMSPLQASLNTGYWGGQTPATIYNSNSMNEEPRVETPAPRIHVANSLNTIVQNTLLEELLGGILAPGRGRTMNSFWRFYDAVPIVPTTAEINAGSQILESSGVAADAICAVCQDHDSPRDISGNTNLSNGWRLLVNCQHKFHKDCIDRWFEGHVVCPVCRADIRIQPTQSTPAGHSEAESQAIAALSSLGSQTGQ